MVRILNPEGVTVEIEDKFKLFNLTDEMAENFRFLGTVVKRSDGQTLTYTIKTIVLGEREGHSTEQGESNA